MPAPLIVLASCSALSLIAEEPAGVLPEMTVEGKAEPLVGLAVSASQGRSSAEELAVRPFLRRGELLEVVPGMTVTQHAGGGKANQYFLRGLNLDHGTDFGIFIDGMPVNLRTHAHGQGYADLNILIPELVESLDYRKGPSYADFGDLTAAGAARFRLRDALPHGIAAAGWGEYGHRRALLADTISFGGGGKTSGPENHLTYAAEWTGHDGPWELPENASRWNGLLRWVHEDAVDRFALTAMGYDGRWTSSDQIPRRAVADGSLSRFGNLDPTNGGTSSRWSLLADWTRQADDGGSWHADAWVSRYDLQLFSNFTYRLDDPVRGDQFEQDERRWMAGGTVRRDWQLPMGGGARRGTMSVGVDARADWIDDIGLHRTEARNRWGTVRTDDVRELSAGVFVSADLPLTDWLRVQPGVRADGFHFRTQGPVAANAGSDAAGLVSPKLNLALGPWADTEFYVNTGFGFHSNDARGVLTTRDPVTGDAVPTVDPLVRLFGVEAGVRTQAMSGWVHTLSLWHLESDSELVYVGDAGTNEAGPASRRTGIELATYWRPNDWFQLDSELTLTDARFVTGGPDEIPNSVPLTWSAGVTVGRDEGFFATLRARHFAARPLEETGSVHSRSSFLCNARLGWRGREWEVAVDCLNLFDRGDNDIEYFYESRLQGEPGPVADVHLHPIEPRSFRFLLTRKW